MADIRFYDFNFNLLRILPPYAENIGYKAINTKQELNGPGSVEIDFQDPILKKFIESHSANILVKWRDFCGVLKSYRWTDDGCKVTGSHLNGLLHRAVVPAIKNTDDEGEQIPDTVSNILTTALNDISWLLKPDFSGLTKKVTYGSDNYEKADTFLQGLFDEAGLGCEIKADFQNKTFSFEVISPENNALMLSKGNLNAYGFETTYISNSQAFGGWYKNEEEWKYITLDATKEGIFNIDTVLSSDNEADAMIELKKSKAEFEILATLKNLEYGKDYKIGDVLRVHNDGQTVKRLVSGIERYEEGGYFETPIMTNYDEEAV